MPSTALSREEILALYRAALAWEDDGHSASTIREKLRERGVGSQQAAAMMGKLAEYRAAFAARPLTANDAVGIALWAFGLLVTMLGGGLFVGNVSGLAPTVPFAGYVVMGLGSALLTAAANRTNRI